MPFLEGFKSEDTGNIDFDDDTNEEDRASGARLLEGFKPEDTGNISFEDTNDEGEETKNDGANGEAVDFEAPTLSSSAQDQTIDIDMMDAIRLKLTPRGTSGATNGQFWRCMWQTPRIVPKPTLPIVNALAPAKKENEDIAEALIKVLIETGQAVPDFLEAFQSEDTGNIDFDDTDDDGEETSDGEASYSTNGVFNGASGAIQMSTSGNEWRDAPDGFKADVADTRDGAGTLAALSAREPDSDH
ncbi:hypothetical protein MMC07_003903 [Pseudocyphellaria aurata]|nr:hypothetical protein [Pseudocyphellaria aurata]